MSILSKIQEKISATSNEVVFGLSSDDIRTTLAELIAPQDIAFIHLTYPSVDNFNHKSRDSLVAKLSGHGFMETAELVSNETPYLTFKDLLKALKVYHEIQQDSAAVSASLYYSNKKDFAAVEAIQAKLPKTPASGPHLATVK